MTVQLPIKPQFYQLCPPPPLPDLNALIHQLWTLSTLDTHPDQFIPEIPIYTSVVPGIEVVIKEVTYWFSASLKYKNMTKTANYFEVL